jgi:cbb3-type cytochrome oxidase subunit 3
MSCVALFDWPLAAAVTLWLTMLFVCLVWEARR